MRNVCTSTSPPSSSADILRALDQALENTFPASDPVSVEQPTSPAADRERATHTAGCDLNLDVSGRADWQFGLSSWQFGAAPCVRGVRAVNHAA